MAGDEPSRRWRLIPQLTGRGAANMALDHALLESAMAGECPPTLRFYRWSPPALSIGRFQPIEEVDLAACQREGAEVVRRPTGGKSILHMDDFTYSIVFPRDSAIPDSVIDSYRLICEGILRALRMLGFSATIQARRSEGYRSAGGACFAAATQADLECEGRKLCGSAQVRRGGSLLQHGSILLSDHSELLFRMLQFESELHRTQALDSYRRRCAALSHFAEMCAWDDLADSFIRGFREAFGVSFVEGSLSKSEEERWRSLTLAYASPRWLYNLEASACPPCVFYACLRYGTRAIPAGGSMLL